MDDRELAQMREDLADKLQLISELQDEAAELKRKIDEEEAARQDGGTVHELRPRPSNGPNPTDQGSV